MPRQFQLPAEYYDAPLTDVRPIFPKWVPYGCGSVSIVFLMAIFAGGTLFSSGQAGNLMATLFARMHDEMARQYTPDVKPQQKAAFDSEFQAFEANLRNGTAPFDRVETLVQAVQEASGDGKITPAEVDKVVKTLDDINRAAAAKRKR